MSFHWNLSSTEDEDDDDDDDDDKDKDKDGGFPKQQSRELSLSAGSASLPWQAKPSSSAAAALKTDADDENDDDSRRLDSDDEDSIDWEDVEDEEEEEEEENNQDHMSDSPPERRSLPLGLKPVSIDVKNPADDNDKREQVTTTKKPKVRSRKVYRNKSLPPDTREFLYQLHKTHLLTLVSRAVHQSSLCLEEEVLCRIHSLVPMSILESSSLVNDDEHDEGLSSSSSPTEEQLHPLTMWYFDFIHGVNHRRRQAYRSNVAAGAAATPRATKRRRRSNHQDAAPKTTTTTTVSSSSSSSSLSLVDLCELLHKSMDENPQLHHHWYFGATISQKTLLFLSLVRSLGWRARLVTSLDPISVDLHVDHPLFLMNAANALKPHLAVDTNDDGDKKPAAAKPSPPLGQKSNEMPNEPTAWVEVLVEQQQQQQPKHSNPKKPRRRRRRRWIHVDVEEKWYNQPQRVESLLLARRRRQQQQQQQQQASKKNKKWAQRKGPVGSKRSTLVYALAVEHHPNSNDDDDDKKQHMCRLTDVTSRYAQSWSETLRARGMEWRKKRTKVDNNEQSQGLDSWWKETLQQINHRLGGATTKTSSRDTQQSGKTRAEAISVDNDEEEKDEEDDKDKEDGDDEGLVPKEAMPTSKAGFKNHPVYALASQLGVQEVLSPHKHVCGMFKGQVVYRRSDVSTALAAPKWPYHGRRVLEGAKPVKRIKARRKASSGSFKALGTYGVGVSNDGSEEARRQQIANAQQNDNDDGMVDLFAHWQTEPWSPAPVGPGDEIPVNEYKNVELELINPGLVHLEAPRMAQVAKRLGL